MATLPDDSMGNMLAGFSANADEELTTPLLRRAGVVIERIVSTGQSSPTGFWYDQPHDEWVLLIAGSATLEIEGAGERKLAAGDYLLLPAQCRHRVAATAASEPTVWLAVHFAAEG